MTIRKGTRRPLRRVLVVEDNPERIAFFKNALDGADVVFARNYADAVRVAVGSGVKLDEVWLDFDLDDASHNGQDVAFLLTSLPPERRPELVAVHSTNLRGAYGIFVTLTQAGFNAMSDPFVPARFRNNAIEERER